MPNLDDQRIALKTDIQNALSILKNGKILLYPTDTIWGLGCDPFNQEAVHQIYTLKKRPRNLPLILLASDIDMVKYYAPNMHPRVESLLEIHKNPLTLVHRQCKHIPDYLMHSDGSIAIRIVHDPFCTSLVRTLKKPIVSTSANIHSQPAPAIFSEISSDILSAVDYVVKERQLETKKKAASAMATYDNEGELTFIR